MPHVDACVTCRSSFWICGGCELCGCLLIVAAERVVVRQFDREIRRRRLRSGRPGHRASTTQPTADPSRRHATSDGRSAHTGTHLDRRVGQKADWSHHIHPRQGLCSQFHFLHFPPFSPSSAKHPFCSGVNLAGILGERSGGSRRLGWGQGVDCQSYGVEILSAKSSILSHCSASSPQKLGKQSLTLPPVPTFLWTSWSWSRLLLMLVFVLSTNVVVHAVSLLLCWIQKS